MLEDADATVDEIVGRIYADTSTDLHPLAKLTVMAHLEMATGSEDVVQIGQKWHRVDKRQETDFRE
jgi:hypothetical protein